MPKGVVKKNGAIWRHFFWLGVAVMKLFHSVWFCWAGIVTATALVGCQLQTTGGGRSSAPSATTQMPSVAVADRITIDAPMAWGAEARCAPSVGCRLVVIEHEEGRVALHQFNGRASRLLDRQPVAYHPDSAIWLADNLVAAAVENAGSLDIFRIEGERLVRVHQIHVGFAPRDVILVSASQGHYKLLATPYSGKEVAWVDWHEDNRPAASAKRVRWCEAPWHPVRLKQIPGLQGAGFAVACLDDRKVVAVPEADPLASPQVLASFDAVARQARPSPSGQWLYVALETGARNARINMQTGELQWIASPLTGSVAVAPLSDDLVAWGEDGKLYIQRLGADGKVLETRWLKTGGFSTGLQLIDLDGDGERDLVVLNSVDPTVDVIYGPLWDRATERP